MSDSDASPSTQNRPGPPAAGSGGLTAGLLRLWSHKLEALLLTAGYLLLALLETAVASVGNTTATIALASGLAVAALLSRSCWLAPGVFLGALLAALAAGRSPAAAGADALASTVFALLAVYLLVRRLGYRPGEPGIRHVFSLFFTAAVTAPVAAAIGAAGLVLGGDAPAAQLPGIWALDWLGYSVGMILVAPPALSWMQRPAPSIGPGQALQGLLIMMALVGVSVTAFDGPLEEHGAQVAMASLVFPLMVWAALQLPPTLALLGPVLAAAAAVWGTARGVGPFASSPAWQGLVFLNVPLAALVLMSQVLAAANTQRRESDAALRISEERFRALVQNSKDIITIHDAAGTTLYESPSAARLLGYGEIGKNPFTIIHPKDLDAATQAFQRLVRSPHAEMSIELRYRKADGSWIFLETVGSNRLDQPGIHGIVLTFRDVTERKQAEQALRASEQRYMLAMEGASDGMWEINPGTRELYVSPRLLHILGYEADLLKDTVAWEALVHPQDIELYRRALQSHLKGETDHLECEYRIRGRDGEYRWIFSRGIAARDKYGKPLRMAGSIVDITERKRAEARIEHLATRDALTDLPNRLLLNDRLAQYIHGSQRSGASFALLFIDLDRFKTINDSLGHGFGDELLQRVAERLAECLRRDDTLARLGGDEFVVALHGMRDSTGAAQVAQKILKLVARPYQIQGRSINTSCSIGISIFPFDGQDIQTLMKNADTAMYYAKDRGRNNYQFFSADMTARAVERLTVENDLRRALERGEFVLHFQPQVSVRSGLVEGVEALVRWQHPEKGLVMPSRFIGIAEETGLIAPLGEWVLSTACAQLRQWQDAGLQRLKMAVNLSVGQFANHNELVRTVSRVLADSGIDPAQLELEITESLLLHNIEEHMATLNKLGKLGTPISVDDFGTGYSSLSYLKRLPIDVLKIDRSFVRDLEHDPDDAAIVSAILALAHSLKLKVVAEGVESRGQLDALRRLDCDWYQGHLFSRALPAGEFAARFLRSLELPFNTAT